MIDFPSKEKYDAEDLVRIVEILRGEGGCPWDRVQTHETLRRNLLEECDELCEAIDRDDPDAWKNELANVRFLPEEGMSGSAQFSEAQFRDLAKQLRERSANVWIVDCRLESHGLINGIAVSWCGPEKTSPTARAISGMKRARWCWRI